MLFYLVDQVSCQWSIRDQSFCCGARRFCRNILAGVPWNILYIQKRARISKEIVFIDSAENVWCFYAQAITPLYRVAIFELLQLCLLHYAWTRAVVANMKWNTRRVIYGARYALVVPYRGLQRHNAAMVARLVHSRSEGRKASPPVGIVVQSSPLLCSFHIGDHCTYGTAEIPFIIIYT